MHIININKRFTLGIEKQGTKLRLIVYACGVENVCRKESVGSLRRFFNSNEQKLFNGRLQLHKYAEHIVIQVKGEAVGMINNRDLLETINMVNDQPI